MNTQEAITNLTNIDTELNSTVQGHVKATTELVRSSERENYHIELLITLLDKKRPQGTYTKNQSQDT